MVIFYMALYLGLYKLALDLPRVLKAERNSDVFGISVSGSLSILNWRVLLVALILALVTAHVLHGA